MTHAPAASLEPAPSTAKSWRRVLLHSLSGGLLAFVIAARDVETWPGRLRILAISLIYANAIGLLSTWLVPRIVAWAAPRGGWRLHAARLVALLVATFSGIAAGAVVLVAIGLIRPADFATYVVPARWPVYVVPTILFIGIGISLYETMRGDLEAATLRLRTKERDEALAQRAALEAQFSALEARVQPHFLFNTLNAIASLIPDDPAAAERMVTQLSALMRSSLESEGARLVTLDEELRVVGAYLGIERARFGDRLRCDVRAEDGLGTVGVPRLSVQTLVENAVKYAVSPRREGASVVVRAAAGDGRVRIEVADDGPGFDPRRTDAGHGLALLQSRLAMLFDGRASLTIDSRPGATSVVMEVPLR